VFVIRPTVGDSDLSVLGHAVVTAYPVGDLVMLAMVVRILLSGGARGPAFWSLVGSLLVFLAGDVAWVVLNQIGVEPGGLGLRLLQANFLLAYVLAGATTLHRSVREVDQPAPMETPGLSRTLLASLTVTSLIAPLVLVIQALRGQVTDGVAISVGAAALFLLVVTRMAGLLRQIESQARQLGDLALVDALTGLPNRRAWSAELPAAIERARRARDSLSVAMIDLDRFKQFNDTFGHLAGDRLLKEAAAKWSSDAVRAVDQLARYGGEEFILLMPGAGTHDAVGIVDRLRHVVPAGQTFSAGVATWDGTEVSEELVARADRALYEAKLTGRDRVVAATGDEPVTRSS
jgi:diguanylate cyclase (GGDEF)-like protein